MHRIPLNIHLILALFCTGALLASPVPRPGQSLSTPVTMEILDQDTYTVWENGQQSPASEGNQDPSWILWTDSSNRAVGHNGLTFGDSKVAGARHLRIGFKELVPVGSLLTRGNVSVSVLKTDAAYPGDLANDDVWLPGKRWIGDTITTSQAENDECALWVFPAGTTTRALRFTHLAARTNASYRGWLGGAVVLPKRWVNLAPMAMATASANNRQAERIVNGMSDGWGAWENTDMNAAELAQKPAISTEHPEWVQLTWTQPVNLDGLVAIWSGFGAAEIQTYTGPEDRHPRDASDEDWTTIATPTGFECGYPSTLWPNYLPFASKVKTRAIRLRITAASPVDHPHVNNKVAKGKRVWLGELLAVQDIAQAQLPAPSLAKPQAAQARPPIPVSFTLPEAGYVTLVIEDATGMRVRNLVSETWFPAGKNTAWWDGTDDLTRDEAAAQHGLYNIPARFVQPGAYTARGLWHTAIKPIYEFPVYSTGNPPWSTPDHTGAWLANHSPPSAATFVPASLSPTGEDSVFLGCYVTEGPDGMAWVDLDGNKRGGMKWIGGNWTAAPYLTTDTGPNADPRTAAYVASVWETAKHAKVLELRLTALEKGTGNRLDSRAVLTEELTRWLPEDAQEKLAHEQVVGAIAAYDGIICCSLTPSNRLLFIDAATGKILREASVDQPRGLCYDATGRLLVISGTRVLRLDDDAEPTVIASSGLEAPHSLTIDKAGNLYISDHGASHQVKVYMEHPPKPGLITKLTSVFGGGPAPTPPGEYSLVHAIGTAGKPQAGPYDPLHMNHPAGLAIDSRNQLWVTENDYLPKRVSVWTLDGELIRAFYGPGKYGGGGMLDAHDSHRFYYADEGRGTLEFSLDWKTGSAHVTSVLYRRTADSLQLPFRAAAPETAIYHGSRRYLTNCYNSSPTGGHGSAFIFLVRDGVAQPVAGLGMANEWPLLKQEPFLSLWPEGVDPDGDKWRDHGKNQAIFIWSDTNEDGQVQLAEVQLHQALTRGITVMDDLSFCAASVNDRAMRFRPVSISPNGVPSYVFEQGEVLVDDVKGPITSGGCQVLADDSDESVITLGIGPFHAQSISGAKDGQPAWSYPSPSPGLQASHHAAKPDRPGQIIGTTRLLGSFVHPAGSEVEPLWAINGNMGNLYLFTRDGLFVSTIFQDVRQGKLWKMLVADRGMDLTGISLHDENFWPSISQTPAGQIYLVDGANCSLVRLDGLDSLRSIPRVAVEVTPELLRESQQYVIEQEALRQQAFGSGLLQADLRQQPCTVDGDLSDWRGADWVEIDSRGAGANFNSTAKPYRIQGAMAAAGDNLYLAWDTNEPNLLRNSGEIPNALFKTGGALDLMLGCDPNAPADRREPVAGDLRLLVTLVNGKTQATLYRPVVPGTPDADKIPFSSPWRTIRFDQVRDVSADVKLATNGKGAFELAIPLQLLGLTPKPGLTLKGDMGILQGNGSETTARSYWSNKATGITADVPSEAMLTPYLWGSIEWKQAD